MSRAVLLDIDGTLIDSNDAHARAWEEALRGCGFPVSFNRVRRLIGTGSDKLLPTLIGVHDESKVAKELVARRQAIFQTLLPTLQPTPGAAALLSRLDSEGMVLTVATSADEDEVSALLEIAGATPFIRHITSADDVERSKPDPDIMHAALKKAGVSAGEAILIGDTPYDIEAAARAGIGAIALRCGGWWSDADLAGALAIYDDPEDLLVNLERSPINTRHGSPKGLHYR